MKYFVRTAAVLCVFAAILLGCKGNVSTPIAVTSVTLDKATVSLVEQETVTLKATVKPEKATNKAVTWSSNKPDVAAVDKDGKVTAHKAGEATITVTTIDGGKTASCKVTVTFTEYTITYNLNGGSHSGNPASYTVETETITLKGAAKANYTFAGWYEKADFTGEKVTQIVKGSSGNKEFWAKFLENYSITYHLNDGMNDSDNPAKYTVETGTITLKDASKANYRFAGWYANAGFTGEKVTQIGKGSSGNKEFWAKWKINEYAVTYHLNGGSNHADNPASYTVETGTITLKPANKADHIFFGWYASADFSGEKVTEIRKGSSGSKELYAKFIEMKMIDIAAVTNGTLGHADYSDRNGVHTVSLTAYRIGESEVTQELWQAVMGNNPSRFKGAENPPDGSEVQKKRPVEGMNWYQCIAFCNELTKQAGLGESECLYYSDAGYTKVYTKEDAGARKEVHLYTAMNKKGFRLPTEAEWEWAAKGGTDDKWAGVNEESKLGEYAWYGANSDGKTHEVKQKQANGYGLYDMSGNVWEWCWDWYDPLPNPLPEDYSGAASGYSRVFRGGSWRDDAGYASRAYRTFIFPDASFSSYGALGLRVVTRP